MSYCAESNGTPHRLEHVLRVCGQMSSFRDLLTSG